MLVRLWAATSTQCVAVLARLMPIWSRFGTPLDPYDRPEISPRQLKIANTCVVGPSWVESSGRLEPLLCAQIGEMGHA